MFRTDAFKESVSHNVRIDPEDKLGLKAYAVQQLVDYMYTGRIDISDGNAFDLIRAADMLQMFDVRTETLRVLEDRVSLDTCVDIRALGTTYNSPGLVTAADRYCRQILS